LDILLSDIDKTYDDNKEKRVIFKNMSAQFLGGRFYVIIGKSGVGKSSLLNLISGIDLPDKGTIQIGGTPISGMTDAQRTVFRRRHIGFIYQFFNLVPVLTVLENITLICELDKMPKKTYMDRAKNLLKQTGMYDLRNHFPDTLSGGEQQRVAIVRSLVNDPEIILADEPTGNLDLGTGKVILDMIADLAEKENKTLVMVTHSPEAMSYADQVMQVEDQMLVPETNGSDPP
jgi:putative ABC transport system ATP-binding protein